jgi:hypothetical protein
LWRLVDLIRRLGDDMRVAAALALALATCLLGTAQAHEGGTHSRGTVKEITADRLVLTTAEGANVTVAMAPDTRILRGQQAIRASDVRPGERAVVHAATREGRLQATEVMVAPSPK